MVYKAILLVVCFSFVQLSVHAQRFIFGAEGAVIASQVDGDKLRGFNKLGYSFGLIGGYEINESNYLIVSPQFSNFGSRYSNEINPRDEEDISVELDMTSANILFAYSYRFGDTWEGNKRFRLRFGTRIHRVLKFDTNILAGKNAQFVRIEKGEDLSSNFLSLDIGIGINASRKLGIILSYTHGINNLLENQKNNIISLQPYYLSLGLSYYFGLPTVNESEK